MNMTATQARQKILIIGITGYLGHAVGRAFSRKGWDTYGLVRSNKMDTILAADEITPILGNLDDQSLPTTLTSQIDYFNVILVTVEDLGNYLAFFNNLIKLSRDLATFSNAKGVRPLVMLTSGMKDYGETALDGDPDLHPLTEDLPINPPPGLQVRAETCGKILEQTDLFDGVLVCPSNLYGLTGSTYGYFFQLATEAKEKGYLELPADPKTILHSMHVGDAAEAMVALSEDRYRETIKQQLFQVAGRRYETLEEIGQALVKEYDIHGGIRFLPRKQSETLDYYILGFSQWISSNKIRNCIGWSDKKPLFTEGIHLYRRSFEASVELRLPEVQRLETYIKS